MRKTLLFLFTLSLGLGLFAQDYKITTGVVEYNNGDFKQALKALNEGLSDPSALKSKNLPKAYYYRGQTYLMLLGMAAREKDESLLLKYKDAALKANDDFQKAYETDDGKWAKKIDAQMARLVPSLLNGGLTMLNEGNKLKGPEKEIALKEAVKYFDACAMAKKEGYMAYDLRAQATLSLGDSATALADFQQATTNFQANLPARPDQLIAYSYYRSALIYRYKDKNIDKALEMLKAGDKLIDSEKARIKDKAKSNPEKYTAEEVARLDKQYADAKKDLSSFRLDLLLNAPEKLDDALKEFELAIVDEPDNYIQHVAYATLLEGVDQEKAILMYEKAIEIDPTKELAFFNLGAVYNNMAKEMYDKANDEEDYKKAEEMQKEVDAYFGKALPNFEKALGVNPNSLATVRALKQITIRLSKMEDYDKYKEMEAKLSGGN